MTIVALPETKTHCRLLSSVWLSLNVVLLLHDIPTHLTQKTNILSTAELVSYGQHTYYILIHTVASERTKHAVVIKRKNNNT